MKAFTNGYDTYVARDEQDLLSVIQEHLGPGIEISDDKWFEVPGDTIKTIGSDDGNNPRTMTVAEWIALQGRGLLCSTEF